MKSGIIIHPSELSKKWIDRLSALKIDTLGLHPEGGASAIESLRKLTLLLETKSFRDLIDYAVSKGLSVEYQFHAMSYLLDRALFCEHPEYFRMDSKGIRTCDVNLCPSSKEALKIVADNSCRLAKKLYKSSQKYFFWLDDVMSGKCHCPNCRNYSASDQQMTVINAIASALKANDTEAKVAYLAYYETLDPPTKVKPLSNVFLEYAPIDKCKQKLNNSDKTKRGYEKEIASIDPLLKCFGINNSRVLEYWIDNSLFSSWKKPPKKLYYNAYEIKNDVSEYTSKGFADMCSFGCFLGEDYEALYGEPDLKEFADAINSLKNQ